MSALPYTLSALAGGSQPVAYIDANFNALRNVTPTIQTTAYTTVVGDHLRPIYVTGNTTISLGDAATMVVGAQGYQVIIINVGTGTVTVQLTTAGNTLCGALNGKMTIPPRRSVLFGVNAAGTGYEVLGTANGVLFDSTDPSKQVKFDLSNLTTGTTRTITMPDGDIVLGTTFSTGDVKLTLKTVADAGWVLMNDGTIGDASSGATTRANADTSALFTLLWSNTANTDCPVSGGRGASASADFAAHKTMQLPRALGRALACYGSGSYAETYTSVTAGSNALPIAANNTKWVTGMPVTLTNVSGFTGLANGSYFVVRVDSTHISFSTTLANAQNGTVVTVTGTGNATITYSLTARTLGEAGGEEAHAMSSTELLSHVHTTASLAAIAAGSAWQSNVTPNNSSINSTNATGGNAAMNTLQPTTFLNVMLKL